VLVLVALVGAGGQAAPLAGGVLTVGLDTDPSTLDPHASAALDTWLMDSLNVTEGLLYQRPNGRFVPWLATDYTVSSDGRTVTFALRKDVVFSDGTPFNAAAVKWNFDRIVDPSFRAGPSIVALTGYAGATVVNDATVQIHFKAPYAPFLAYLADGLLGMLSPESTGARGKDVNRTPVGTGPFAVAEYVLRDHARFVRNAQYNRRGPWGGHQGPPYLDEVVWKIIPEGETRAITVSTGETQMIYLIGYGGATGAMLAQLQKDARLTTDAAPYVGTSYLWLLDVRRFPTDDLQVRRALSYGIDRVGIVKTVYKGLGAPGCGILSHTLLRDPAACAYYPYDPRKAAALLDADGWKVGADGVRYRNGRPLTLVINSLNLGAGDLPDVELVQGELINLGFSVTIKSQTIGPRTADNFQCADNTSTIFSRRNDFDVLFQIFDSANIGSNSNWSCYSNPEVDRLLQAGRIELNPAKRQAIYVQIDHILLDQAVAIPMMDELSVWVRRSTLKGVSYDYSNFPALGDAHIEK